MKYIFAYVYMYVLNTIMSRSTSVSVEWPLIFYLLINVKLIFNKNYF